MAGARGDFKYLALYLNALVCRLLDLSKAWSDCLQPL